MKLSNFMLSLVAITCLSVSFIFSYNITAHKSSSLISLGNSYLKMPEHFSKKQVEALQMAIEIAIKDGHSNPQLLQGIILQETNAGELNSFNVAGQEFGLRPNERYYGIAQIKLAAAKDVLKYYPGIKNEFNMQSLTDEEIIANLILNTKYNLTVASKYLKVLKTVYNVPENMLAAAYNQGAGGKDNERALAYSQKVKNHIRNISK